MSLMDERNRLVKLFDYQPGQNLYVVNFNGYVHRYKITHIELKLLVDGVAHSYYEGTHRIQTPNASGKSNYFSDVHSWHTTLKAARKAAEPMAEAKRQQDIEAVQRELGRTGARLGELEGYTVIGISNLSLEATEHGRILEMIGNHKQPNEIQMRTDQFVKLVGNGLIEAGAIPQYRGMRVRFVG